MAFELSIKFITQSAETEEEARAELALFLANTPGNMLADNAGVVELELVGVDDLPADAFGQWS